MLSEPRSWLAVASPAIVQRHGDTTDASDQIKVLRSLGIQARFRPDGRIEQLIAQLQPGLPIPVGWLHHGPASAPTGGGHWSLVIGWDPASQTVLMHDPNGEADLVGGWLCHHGHREWIKPALLRQDLGTALDGGGSG